MGSAASMGNLEIGMGGTQIAPHDVVTTADNLATMASRVNTNRVNTRNFNK